jgi:predicted small secreted protein
VSGETVYVGGAFTSIGDQARSYIAAVDAISGEVTSWAPNSNGWVHALAVSGGTVYAGGGFRSIGGQPRNYIAALDAATGEVTPWNPNASGDAYPHPEVYALAVSEGTVYAGGNFNCIGGQPRNNIAALDTATGEVTPWNPNAITDGIPPSLPAVTVLAVSEGTVYVGGYFSNIGGQPRNRIAALNAVTGEATPWNPNADAEVWALAFSEGKVYVAGYFWNIGGQPRHRIAALDVVTGEATSWNPDVNGSVYALAAGKGTVYAGGGFTSFGGQTRNYIAAVDAVTGEVTSWAPNSNDGVHTLVVSGGTVYAGGSFTSIGGQTRTAIAALGAVTGEATSWNPKSNGGVSALAVSGGTIYVGGDFTMIGGQRRNRIAALDAVTGEATSWNPNADSSIGALAVNGGAVYAAGSDTFGGVRVGSIAQFGVYPLTITPGKLGFDRFCVGATSPCKTLTLTNLLETDLLIDSILLTGPDSEDFIVQSDLCSGIVLTPSGSCTVELSFSPSSKTARFAYVTISSNTPKAWTVDVPLNGTGTFPLALLSPNEWEVIPSGSTYNITWCAPSEAVEFKLQYSTNNGETWKTIASNLSGMTHQWEVPVLQSTRVACHVKVVAYDDTGIKVGADKSDDLFRIEVASITAPFIFEIVPKGTVAYPVTWTMSAAISENVSSATVSYTLGKSGIWKKAVGTVVDPLTGFSWDVPSPAERKNAKLKVVFRDISGDKVATAISSIFRIE